MNWDALAAIGQTVSALALIFVLMQIRHARADMRRSVLDSMANAFIATVPISCDQRVLGAMIKAEARLGGEHAPFVAALMEQTGLTTEEALLVHLAQAAQWNAVLPPIRCRDSLTPRDLVTLEFNLRRIFGKSPVGRLWYEKRAKTVSNPYDLAYIDRVLAEPG